jgi:hypothetical protein
MSSFSVVNDSLSLSDINQLQVSPIGLERIDPVSKPATNFAVTSQYDTYVASGATGVVLPPAYLSTGRILHFKVQTAAALSAVLALDSVLPAGASNVVVPAAGGAAGSAIVAAAAGNSATLVSNGVNWYNIKNTTM